ncbi:GNAT family N-acetyltransferase [Ferrimonas balearica]|uniref:GNAT family N-acetyltransferase n=1 Tax=Ferrimonas balearica TaxID=44012 RepID=UPI001C9A0D11|nr:GNAT family N-acetyltransferase [Ferrimonas balearica]MBY5991315.1 GNAT family N-acetyltransferase [Ferrimonas balearica]
MQLREATDADWDALWPLFHAIVHRGDTYAIDPNISKADGQRLWLTQPLKTFLVEDEGQLLGTYYLKTNQPGPGSHVCNCGYMVAPEARGRGLATLMCQHSLSLARQLGYRAMQFNFVATSNSGAVRLWHKLGFDTVGRLPGAFAHPKLGWIDALVMHQSLTSRRHDPN